MLPYLSGFGLGAGLIIAIGAQNALVLQHGLKRRAVFLTAFICTLCDAALILLGVGGLGAIIAQLPALATVTTLGGALFLFLYGARSFRAAFRSASLDPDARASQPMDRRAIILAVCAVSLLNPHVYLDTVVLVGSVGAAYPVPERAAFAFGAISASFVWFFGLAYGAALLAPVFRNPRAWRALDIGVGIVMWAIAFSLARGLIAPV
ncbi:MAG: amino acid transporter [Chloroflexi bacterium]|nr:amino acid transporter [Chloroflexota bacterium]